MFCKKSRIHFQSHGWSAQLVFSCASFMFVLSYLISPCKSLVNFWYCLCSFVCNHHHRQCLDYSKPCSLAPTVSLQKLLIQARCQEHTMKDLLLLMLCGHILYPGQAQYHCEWTIFLGTMRRLSPVDVY